VWIYTRSANSVGGDLVDYIGFQSGDLGLALGDVSGKGLGAALLMSKVQATLRALAEDGQRLDRFGAAMNRILCRDGIVGRFATLVYLELSPGSGAIRLLNAGHMPPLILSGSGVRSLAPVALPLGVDPDEAYVEEAISLAVGEILVIYSDGVTEASNEAHEFFGEDRLLRLLPDLGDSSAERLGRAVLSNVNTFIGETPLDDDISLVIVRRSENGRTAAVKA
jgi:sigma-B regulation protein RsbU (phosphoserine phosphatase)